jgi:DNA-binding transcriptional LysR family regulator
MNPTRDLPVSLDLLRGFEAAARLLSFTGAAAELFLTQSAVSRQVQQLEEQLGVKLFERRTRALELTDAGERYFREGSKALNHLREATAMVRALSVELARYGIRANSILPGWIETDMTAVIPGASARTVLLPGTP